MNSPWCAGYFFVSGVLGKSGRYFYYNRPLVENTNLSAGGKGGRYSSVRPLSERSLFILFGVNKTLITTLIPYIAFLQGN